ncbi:uncharacterized protein BDZ99DRAFT_514409 [Mytilinidion resinicola]|uniref:Uncharacterized protein n=1 Tax=Mytilinidion resinicola TaxID=574789 RepID=A0A6A6Z3N1_9PEZI|nr:uncharacterized protein BDZ99DRAFT_514409 [Mytilinidion resinicola]KAF2815762.1 hypothetical protein BDZ99DRAFT_514409 [Mytilinidion resinicola]
MCITRNKLFTCGCRQGPKREICRAAIAARAVCEPIPERAERVSYFPCYDCIRADVFREKEAAYKEEVRVRAEAEREREKGWVKAGERGAKGTKGGSWGYGGGGGRGKGEGSGGGGGGGGMGLGIDLGGGPEVWKRG